MKSFATVGVAVLLAGCAAPPAGVPGGASRATHEASAGEFAGWHDFMIPGKQPTQYEPLWLDGAWVVRARSSSAASMFRRPLRIEAKELGQVSFDWRIEHLLDRADLTDADQADSPVRVVLAFDGDHAKLSMKNRMMFELAQTLSGEQPPYATLMYVWDNKVPLETVLPGGRSDRIRKIVVESGGEHAGSWWSHRRDIAADFQRAFGEAPGPLIGVALLTDTDNTHTEVQSFYRHIVLHDAAGRAR